MKAPALAVVLHPGHADGGDDGEHEDGEGAKMDAAEALIEAVHAKDAKGVVEAMSAMHDLCAGAEDEDGEEPGGS